ncbi:hypothetical protein CORC01_14253, partial [Colletotrichum orchidophilum]
LSPRHLPWPWKAWPSSQFRTTHTSPSSACLVPCPPAEGLSLVTVLPLHLGATSPTCALTQSYHRQSTRFVLVVMFCPPGHVYDMQVIPPGWEGADDWYLAFIALPRGPHVADSLPSTNLTILICFLRDISPRAHLVAVAEGPGPRV